MQLTFSNGTHRVRATLEVENLPISTWADVVAQKAEKKAEQVRKAAYTRAKNKIDEVKMYFNLMSTDEMTLLLKIEDFATRHAYLGKHWMRWMNGIIVKYHRK